ncbi:MAG: redoxin family protein [Verrucomicrobia subdivision 3 bacterium]|nr:redoxin family protein [Limisphaerales bacterium]
MKTTQMSCSLVVSILFAAAACAQAAAKLKVGDPAPKLQVGKWAQGEEVKELERGKAYLVEFWATWCGPCIISIPHVNEIHTKYRDKDLVVIGQNVWERDPSAVPPFLKKMGQKMTYRVALDTAAEGGKMAETWMEAAGQSGIPAAFLVDKAGLIAWIGHPMKLKEELIEQVLAGSFDIKKAAADYAERQKAEMEIEKLWGEFQQQTRKEEWDRAESTLTRMENLLPENERSDLGPLRFKLLLSREDYKRAYKLAGELSDAQPGNAMMQNDIAWEIATKEGVAERDLVLAEKIARRASEAAKGEDAAILDTLARVLFMKGEKEQAIEFQQKAVDFATGGSKAQFEKVLESYKRGRLPSEEPAAVLRRELSRSIDKGEWDKAEAALKELDKLLPEKERSRLEMPRFRILLGQRNYAAAWKLAAELSDTHKDEPMFQNQLAWEIVTREIDQRDLDLAERIARRGHDATKGNNAELLDTLARVLFMKGQKEPAIEMQQKAVEFAKGRRKEQFQATLDSYKEGKLPKPY